MGLYDYTLYEIWKRNARVYQDRTALVHGQERITHCQVLEKIDRLACGLLNAGLKRGDCLAILAYNSLEFVYLYGAAAKIGAVLCPVNWRLNPEEVEYILSDVSAKMVFGGSEFQDMLAPLIARLGFIGKAYSLGKGKGNFQPFANLLENSGICPPTEVASDGDYVIIHTAAVEGRPRGAVLSQQNLITANLQAMYCWCLTPRDVHLVLLPLFHLAGLGMFFNVLHAGGANVILSRFDAEQALKSIQEEKGTIFGEFSPMLKTLLDKAKEGFYDLSSLRVVAGLDHPATVKELEERTKAVFWTAYGQSETSGFVTLAPYSDKPGSAGTPNFVAEVEVMDDYGNILPPGKTGEIVVRGPMVFKGYWNCRKENEYTFRNDWHHTGDMGRFDADGYLWYAGRSPAKELIKPGGENVYPAEVEKVILEHPSVREAVVIGVPDPQWGEAIKAVCVLRERKSLAENELIEFVAGRIARFKKPKYVVFVSSLPKTPEGFIDRSKVKAEFGKP